MIIINLFNFRNFFFAAEKIGIAHAPPYLAPTTKGPAILQGVNFASAGAGILDSTGYEYVRLVSHSP
jgi:hypothetical protein